MIAPVDTCAHAAAPEQGRTARRVAPALVLAALAALWTAGCGSSAPGRATGALVPIGAGLSGPAGLDATVYAQGPPTTAAFAFDPQGRLWLTAAGLEDHAHDGVYLVARPGAPAVKVLGGLDDPLGLAWHAGSLYVASVGRVDAFGGFDGRRFATHREIIDGPAAGAENNLLALAPDGRFLLGVSATCDHCVPASPWAGAIASFLPDGSGLRPFATRIRAPFGLAFYPGTSELFVTMNQRDDLGARTPGDWLSLVREGQDWRSPGCWGQGGAACAGVPQPVAVLDPHGAVGGVAIVTGQLGGGVGTSAIVPEWNVAKVQRVALRRSGSGWTGTVEPFLRGLRNPLAVAIAPDGSLLAGDWATGTIYRIARAG